MRCAGEPSTACQYPVVPSSERLAGTRRERVRNTYRCSVPDAVPLEPFELPLSPRRSSTVKLHGIFGCLRDASPDAWGRRIIEKHLGRTDLTEADYLRHSPEDRAGALSFGLGKQPPAPRRGKQVVLELEVDPSSAEGADGALASASAAMPSMGR